MFSEIGKLYSFVIALSFISIIPVPQKFIPSWSNSTLRYFCVMLPVIGLIFSLLWFSLWYILSRASIPSTLLRGFFMTTFTLLLTGGLHLDGLMDSCDAIFSHRDRNTRLQILSDTHAGSFAVIGCVIIILAKTLLFSELLTISTNPSLIPLYSRLGMGILLNNMPFAKTGGLAVILGSSRKHRDNILFVFMMILLFAFSSTTSAAAFLSCLALWGIICMRIFGGITGDLLGAFVELSEVIMMTVMVIT